MEKDKLKHSDEDEDTLAQSTKKFKDSHSLTGGREYGVGNKKAIGINWWVRSLEPSSKHLALKA